MNIKNDRVHRLIKLSNQRKEIMSSRPNCIRDIPEEKGSKDGKLVGYADNYMKIGFDGDESLIGNSKVKVINRVIQLIKENL